MIESALSSLLKQFPIGYALHDLVRNENGELTDFAFLEMNSAFEKMTGLKSDDLIGQRAGDVFAALPDSGFDWASFYAEAIREQPGGELERYAGTAAGRYKMTAFYTDPEHLAVILQDMTEEIRSKEALESRTREIEAVSEELGIVFNSTHDAMFLVEYDGESFTYIRNNKTHQELTGYNLAEFAGKTPVELLGERNGRLVEENYRRCVENGQSITYEETLKLRGGRRDWLTNLTPVRRNGQVRYLVGSRTDVTEVKSLRKDKEEALKAFQAMFLEHTASMLLIEPESGRIVNANPSACAFYGYARDELLDMNIQMINLLPQEEVQSRRMKATVGSEQYFLFPHRLKNGETRLVDVYSSPVDYRGSKVLFSIIFDVTDRENYRQAMIRERELLSVTLHSIGDGVITTDNSGFVTSLNKAAEEISGWTEREALGRPFDDVVRLRNEETRKEVDHPIRLVMKSGKLVGLANHTVLIRKDRRAVPINDSAAPIRNEAGENFGVVMVFRDISHDKEQQKQILFLSYHDPLTGLNNRRYMEEQIGRFDTGEHLPLAIVMGDVNGLKITNDVFGHKAGDTLLRKVADILRENCRRNDTLARWGGDEFLLLMPRASFTAAEKFIERAKRSFSEKSEGTLQLSVSMGCAVKEDMEQDLQKIMSEAEEWMYHQKLLEGTSYRNTIINTLLATLYEKSMETETHAERLKQYCYAIGTALELSAEELNELSLLAILHDIGKVGINQSILQKPGPLSAEEWEEMRRHTEIGYRIAQNAPELSAVSDYILSHHERWDGKGYPRNLKGEQIPLLCRILSVADSYDAMTNDRVYRKARPRNEAIQELKENAGTQFDPFIVELFLDILVNESA